MTRATSDIMDALHSLAATGLTEEIRRNIEAARLPRTIVNDDGETVDNPDYQALNPNLIDKALKMLKDNAITAPASNQPLNDLASELAELDLSDPEINLRSKH